MKLKGLYDKIKKFIKSPRGMRILLISAAVLFIAIASIVIATAIGGADNESDEYTVAFITDGGGFIPSQKVERGGKIVEPVEPKREGYVFDGWYYSGSLWDFTFGKVKSNMMLTAAWCEAVTVSFDDGTHVYEVECAKNRAIKQSAIPVISDESFCGWYLGDTRWNLSLPVREDMYLTAGYTCTLTVSREVFDLILEKCPDASDKLGTTIAVSDTDCDITLESLSSLSGDIHLDLLSYACYLPTVSSRLEDGNVSDILLSEDGALLGATIPTDDYSFFIDKSLVISILDSVLLDNSTEDKLGATDVCYTIANGAYSVISASGAMTVNKNLSASDNILSILLSYQKYDSIDLKNARDSFRTYIKQAYSGRYGEKYSELFYGSDAAYDTDELTALLYLASYCAQTCGMELISGIFVDGEDIFATVSLAAELFGKEALGKELENYSVEDGMLRYLGTDASLVTLTERFNAMITSGLITLSDKEHAIMIYGADAEERFTLTASPASSVSELDDGSLVLSRVSNPLGANTRMMLAASQSILSDTTRARLFAAMRLIEYICQ